MNKRGQVYILAAIILAIIFFSITKTWNQTTPTISKNPFQEIANNYATESSKFVNQLLSIQSPTVGEEFRNFSFIFTSYAKTKHSKFTYIYAFIFKNKLYIGNYMDVPVYFNPPGTLLQGCFSSAEASISAAGLTLVVPATIQSQLNNCHINGITAPPPPYKLEFTIEGIKYETHLTPNQPNLIIVAHGKQGKNREVFTRGNFIH